MKTLMIVCLASLPALLFAQPPDSLWSRVFGGAGNDECTSILQTADSGYILGGWTGSFGAGGIDVWTVRTNANGDGVWSRTFGGSGEDACYSVAPAADGSYLLVGDTRSFGAGYYDYWLVKVGESSDSIWSRTFGGSGLDRCSSIGRTSDNGYLLGGNTISFGAGNTDFWLVKTDATGEGLFSHTYGGHEYDECYAVKQTSDGGCVLAGYTESFGAGITDFWLVKTNANGDSSWSRTFGGSQLDVCLSVEQTSGGGYILTGYTFSFGAGGADFWLVKTDANGNQLWSRTFGGSDDDRCNSVHQTADGGYILGGYTESFGAGSTDFWLVKTDANGTELWNRTFGGSGDDLCHAVIRTTDGGYMLAGYTTSFGAGARDFWMVKTGPDPANATDELLTLVPSSPALSAFPNPFNPSATISFSLSRESGITLSVFDLAGGSVKTLAEGRWHAGKHSVLFDGSGLPSGIYFARLTAGGAQATQKLLLLK